MGIQFLSSVSKSFGETQTALFRRRVRIQAESVAAVLHRPFDDGLTILKGPLGSLNVPLCFCFPTP